MQRRDLSLRFPPPDSGYILAHTSITIESKGEENDENRLGLPVFTGNARKRNLKLVGAFEVELNKSDNDNAVNPQTELQNYVAINKHFKEKMVTEALEENLKKEENNYRKLKKKNFLEAYTLATTTNPTAATDPKFKRDYQRKCDEAFDVYKKSCKEALYSGGDPGPPSDLRLVCVHSEMRELANKTPIFMFTNLNYKEVSTRAGFYFCSTGNKLIDAEEDWPWLPPAEWTHVSKDLINRTYTLGINQRLFLLMESPLSCKWAAIWAVFVLLVILFSCSIFILSTVPALMHQPEDCENPQKNDSGKLICEPIPPLWFDDVELICIIIFTFDYLMRIILVTQMPPRLLGQIRDYDPYKSNSVESKLENSSSDVLAKVQVILDDQNAMEQKQQGEASVPHTFNTKKIAVKVKLDPFNIHNKKNQAKFVKISSNSELKKMTMSDDLNLSSLMPQQKEKTIRNKEKMSRSPSSLSAFNTGNITDENSPSGRTKHGENQVGSDGDDFLQIGNGVDLETLGGSRSPDNPFKVSRSYSDGNLAHRSSPTSKQKKATAFIDANGMQEGDDEEDENKDFDVDYSFMWKLLFYVLAIYNIIDLLAIIPFYIQLAGNGTNLSFVRILRLARVMRVFKLGKNMSGFVAISKTIKTSIQSLGVVGFFILLSVLLFGAVEYFIEGGVYMITDEFPDGAYLRKGIDGQYEISPFTSIPASLYWAVVTFVTVGYGDIVPSSFLGKVVACICMYLGVLMMALPITVIGSNFNREYEKLVGNDTQQTLFDTLMALMKKVDDEIRIMARTNKSKITEPFDISEKSGLLLSIVNCLDDIKRHKLQARIEKMLATKQIVLRDNNTSKKLANDNVDTAVASLQASKYFKSIQDELDEIDDHINYIADSNPFFADMVNIDENYASISGATPVKGDRKYSQATKLNVDPSDVKSNSRSPKKPSKYDLPE